MPSNGETEHIYYDHDDQEELTHEEESSRQPNQQVSDTIDEMQDTDGQDMHKPEIGRDSRFKYRQNSPPDHHSDSQEMSEKSPGRSKRAYDKDGDDRRKDGNGSCINEASQAEALPLGCTLYVRNLPTHFQSEQVRSYFSRYGEVIDCRIVINPVTKESRGFGFVTYPNVDVADNAMSQMDQTEVDGRILRVEKARRNKPHDPTPGEYKGPTGASIKYDNRGRLRPGYVPYWDLPLPRTMDRGRSIGGRHHGDNDYHHYRSRSHPRFSRYSHGRDGAPRGRSPSPHYYHNAGHGGYYYSPSPSRDHVPSVAKDSRYYYEDYNTRRRHHDDIHQRGSSYRQHEGSTHQDSASPPTRRGAPHPHWENGARQHYSPAPPHHRSSYSSADRQRHRHQHEGSGNYRGNRRGGNYYGGGAENNGDCSMHSSRRYGSTSPRARAAAAGNVSTTRASPPGSTSYYNRSGMTSAAERHH